MCLVNKPRQVVYREYNQVVVVQMKLPSEIANSLPLMSQELDHSYNSIPLFRVCSRFYIIRKRTKESQRERKLIHGDAMDLLGIGAVCPNGWSRRLISCFFFCAAVVTAAAVAATPIGYSPFLLSFAFCFVCAYKTIQLSRKSR